MRMCTGKPAVGITGVGIIMFAVGGLQWPGGHALDLTHSHLYIRHGHKVQQTGRGDARLFLAAPYRELCSGPGPSGSGGPVTQVFHPASMINVQLLRSVFPINQVRSRSVGSQFIPLIRSVGQGWMNPGLCEHQSV